MLEVFKGQIHCMWPLAAQKQESAGKITNMKNEQPFEMTKYAVSQFICVNMHNCLKIGTTKQNPSCPWDNAGFILLYQSD